MLEAPDKPGLGVELDRASVERFKVRSRTLKAN